MVFFLFLTGGLSLLWFIIGLKMKKTDPNNEIEKSQSKIKIWSLLERETDSSVTGI